MSVSPTKGATPAATDKDTKPLFTDKEEKVLKLAWQCLKSGPPDVDIDKLTKVGEFGTKKTAQNTWGVIKKKLQTLAPPAANEEDGEGAAAAGGETAATPGKATPKAKGSPRKRGKKEAEADGGEGEVANSSPTKKPRKSPVKKGAKAAKAGADEVVGTIEEGEASAVAEEGIEGGKDVKMEEGGE